MPTNQKKGACASHKGSRSPHKGSRAPQKHPTESAGFTLASILSLATPADGADGATPQPSTEISSHFVRLTQRIVDTFSSGSMTTICPDDYRMDETGKYDNDTTICGENSFLFSNGVFHALLKNGITDTLSKRETDPDAKLRVIFTAGTPGSGKSTILSKLREDISDGLIWDTTMASAKFRPISLRNLTKYLNDLLKGSEFSKSDIVEFVCIHVKADLDTCLERNRLRGESGGHSVPNHIIRSMHKQIEEKPPVVSDGFDRVFSVSCDEDYDRLVRLISSDGPVCARGEGERK